MRIGGGWTRTNGARRRGIYSPLQLPLCDTPRKTYAGERNWTLNHPITNRALCQLSYASRIIRKHPRSGLLRVLLWRKMRIGTVLVKGKGLRQRSRLTRSLILFQFVDNKLLAKHLGSTTFLKLFTRPTGTRIIPSRLLHRSISIWNFAIICLFERGDVLLY